MTVNVFPAVHKPTFNMRDEAQRAERTTLVFAIFNITLACVCSISTVAGAVFWFVTIVLEDLQRPPPPPNPPSNFEEISRFVAYGLFTAIIILMVFSFIALLFASFLINGVCKRKPSHVKAYFIYGTIVSTLSLLSAGFYFLITSGSDPLPVAVTLVILFLYSLILSLIRVTYKNYERNSVYQYGNNLLVVASEKPNKI